MTDKNEPGTFNWDHAIYWAEISASELPDRAKNLLRLLFDKFKQRRKEQLEMSVAEAVKGLYDHLGIQTQESSVRRALTNLTSCKILEVRPHHGRRSTWILRPRELWNLTCPSSESQVDRIDRRLREIEEERRDLLRLRCELTKSPGGPPPPPRSTTPSNHVQPRSTTFNLPPPEAEMTQTQNRLGFTGDPEPPPPPRSTTFNRTQHSYAMDAFNNSSNTSIASHPSGGARGGWRIHLTDEEVSERAKAREVFQKLSRAGYVEDTPHFEREFFAFLATVAELDRKGKVRSRGAYISGAVRGGYWLDKINPTHRAFATALQQHFDAQSRVETASYFESSMPGLGESFHSAGGGHDGQTKVP